MKLKSPYPYFGGKARVADLVWSRLGNVRNYIEPFFGSGAVLLNRPAPFDGVETINDLDGLVANFWRATKADPDAVAEHADWPVNENDLHARHAWLVGQKDSLQARLEGDPDDFDAKIAGWWAWGLACWIGSGFCSGKGPWQVIETDDGSRQLVHLGDAGQGVKRNRVHLTNAGQGVNRKLVHLGDAGRGVNRKRGNHREVLFDYFRALSERLRHVRVCCGDWSRVMGDSTALVRWKSFTPVSVFLDPPYADTAKRRSDLYRIDSDRVAHAVREWAIEHGDDPRYRICLAGYSGEGHETLLGRGWREVAWKAQGGYGNQRIGTAYLNGTKERLFFSPYCINPEAT